MYRGFLLGIASLVTLLCFCAVASASPLQNPSFESGSLSPGWSVGGFGTYSGSVTDIGTHTDGSNYAYIQADDEFFPDYDFPEFSEVFPSNVYLTQTFDLSALAEIMSIDIAYTDSSDFGGGIVEISLLVDGEIAIDFAFNPIDDMFHTYSADISAAAGETATFRVEISSPFVGEFEYCSMSIDNVVITDIPEPATLALLAVGGLAMLRRRSR